MNILHIAAHLGDGAGKAIGGMAILVTVAGNKNRIMLLQEPKKKNHVERCLAAGIEFPFIKSILSLTTVSPTYSRSANAVIAIENNIVIDKIIDKNFFIKSPFLFG